jgi:hypothetical protein
MTMIRNLESFKMLLSRAGMAAGYLRPKRKLGGESGESGAQ